MNTKYIFIFGRSTHREIALLVLTILLAACAPTATPVLLPTQILVPLPTPTSAPPTSVPLPSPTSGPVSFVWQVTGESQPFNSPTGLALDKQGNLYVYDPGLGQVFKYSPDGKSLAQWGGRGSGDGQFAQPVSTKSSGENLTAGNLALDGQGNVYVIDVGNARIQKFDGNGKFQMAIGTPDNGNGQFTYPIAVTVNSQGFIFVADIQNGHIQKFDSSGKYVSTFGEQGSGDGQILDPAYLIADAQDNLYLTDRRLGHVQKFSPDGKFLTKWDHCGTTPIIQAAGVAIDKDGNLYITDNPGVNTSSGSMATLGNRVCKFDRQGQFLFAWGGKGAGDGQFARPSGIAVDDAGNVYVSELGNHRIQKFKQK